MSDYLSAVSAQRAWRNRNRIRRHDGVWRWFENYANPLFDAKGEYAGHVGVSVDITDLVDAEKALRDAQERQAFLLELSDALRPLADPVAIQETACQLLGRHLGVDWAQYSEVDIARGKIINARDYFRGDLPSHVGEYELALYPVHAQAWAALTTHHFSR